MQLGHIRISRQLQIGLGTIMVFVVFLGAVAWMQTDALWQTTQGLYKHPLQVRGAVGEVKAEILSMHRGMKDLVLATTEAERQALLQAIESSEANALRSFELLFDRYLGPKKDIDEAFTFFIQWKAIRSETIRLLLAGNAEEAAARTKMTGTGGSHAAALLAHIQEVSQFSEAKAEEFFQEATRQNQTLRLQLVFVLVAIFLLTVAIGCFLLARIRTPLNELIKVMDRFHQGELNVRSSLVSTNEFGLVAASFNQMAEAIAERIETAAKGAGLAEVLVSASEVQKFAEEILAKFMEVTDSPLGAFYLQPDGDKRFFPLAAGGVNLQVLPPFDAVGGEGQFGRTLRSGEVSHIKDIDRETVFTFKTFAGTAVPREMLTLPLKAGGEVRGMLLLAGLKRYAPTTLQLLDRPMLIALSAAFANLLASDETRRLAEELQASNQELQAQQEELQMQAVELRQQTEEIRAQNVELEQQRLAVEAASRLKSQFLSNMSHELRTPLNSVMALSRVLSMEAKDKLSEEELNYLEIIERNGKNLLTLINDILDLAKIESGRMDVKARPFSLAMTLENIVESLAPLADEKNLTLQLHLPEALPPLESDEVRVAQILQNLIANGIKFTDSGSVTVSARVDGEKVVVQVADTGIGIDEEELPYIFDEFRQVDGSTSRRHEGTGLGLAIARKAVKVLGGGITVSSRVGRGSTFTLSLPLVRQAQTSQFGADDFSAVADSLQPFSDGVSSPLILLIEDNEAAIIQVRSVLETGGYRVAVARGGQEAFDFVAHTIPDGIVCDLMMPEIDGFAVLEQIRSETATAKIPILILTAKDLTPADFQKLSANNVQQLVQKGDVDQESLLRKIEVMLGGRRQKPAPSPAPERKTVVPAPAPFSGKATILVVEDNPDNMVTCRALLQNRYHLVEATNGEEGLQSAEALRPQLILLDMALPGMDGLTVVHRLKDHPQLSAIPVIALTAQAMKGDRERMLRAGCDDYLAKPINPQEFVEKIEAWINQAKKPEKV